MLNLFFRDKELKPVVKKERYGCPFYGFALGSFGKGFLMDQDGNQCALIARRYSPCQMEIRVKVPELENCDFNTETNKETIEKMVNSFQIFPNEFLPKRKSSWKGMKCKDWYDYIMNQH